MASQTSGKQIIPQIPFDVNQLRYFVAAAEQQSFSQAANILHVSQPLISQQIADIERQLGVDLFIRNRRNVTLTPAGSAMLTEARALLARVSDIQCVIQRADMGLNPSGTLRIALEQLFDHSVFAQAIFRFRTKYPSVDIQPCLMRMPEILRSLSDQSLDIGMCVFPVGNLPPDIEYRILLKDHLCFAASSELVHSTKLEDLVWIADCLPCCLLERDFRGTNATMQICLDLGITPQFLFFPDVESVLLQVESGTGFSILPHSVVSAFSQKALSLISLKGHPNADISLAAVWNATYSGKTANLFVNEFCEQFPSLDNASEGISVTSGGKKHKKAVIL